MNKKVIVKDSFIGKQMLVVAKQFGDNYNENNDSFFVEIPNECYYTCNIGEDEITIMDFHEIITDDRWMELVKPEFIGLTKRDENGNYYQKWLCDEQIYLTLQK